MKRRSLILTSLAVGSLVLAGGLVAQAGTIRAASGYPNVANTNGHPSIWNFIEVPDGYWAVVGFRLILTQPTVITGIAGVGGAVDTTEPGFTWSDLRPELNVHSGPPAFVGNTLVPDVYHTANVQLTGTPVLFGKDYLGNDNYYVTFQVAPFELPAGDYAMSLPIFRSVGDWWWAESAVNLGTDIWRDQVMQPGEYVAFGDYVETFVTGTMALDVMGYPVGLYGDVDKNGRVDIFDVAVVQTNYGKTSGATWAQGDFNADGAVNIFDVAMMQVNYGTGVASAPSAVPEPSTLVLGMLGLCALAAYGARFRRAR
ncbi:MAG: dockerin type I domain-containing protein [Pirellulales bacterium]